MNWVSIQGAVAVLLVIFALGMEPPTSEWIANLVYGGGQFLLMIVPFLTMRHHNGWALVWDLMTNSRVVESPKQVSRPLPEIEDSDTEREDTEEWMGPYTLVEKLTDDWLIARDPALRREVWLRKNLKGGLEECRRDLARPSRARWLQSVTIGGQSWEAFEAQSGMSLPDLVDRHGAPIGGCRNAR